MTDIFISYSRDDRENVRHIADALEAEGLDVWWDPEIPPGESFAAVIDRQLKEAACVIVVWSKKSIMSNWVQEEADDGMMRNTLIPIMIDEIDLPRGFKRLQTADLKGWEGDTGNANWQLVIAQVRKMVAAKNAAAAAERQAEQRQQAAAAHPARAAMAKKAAQPAKTARTASVEAKKGGLPLVPIILGLAVIGLGAFGYFFYSQNSGESAPVVASTASNDEGAGDNENLTEMVDADLPNQAAEADPRISEEISSGIVTAEVPAETIADGESIAGALAIDESSSELSANQGMETAADVGSATVSIVEDDAPDAALVATAGEVIKDCDECPQMIVVPAGAFKLGSPDDERSREDVEGPQIDISIANAFAIGAFEVTFAEWAACVADGGCNGHEPSSMGWGGGKRPVVNVSFEDAARYAEWLSEKTGQTYRLPSEAEWEYAARASAEGAFSFDGDLTPSKANFNANYPYAGASAGTYRSKTVEVGSFDPNAFGLYDMHGNVWEWTSNCWRSSHANAPIDGSPVGGACNQRVIKGGGWNAGGWRLRAAHRKPVNSGVRDFDTGFRLVREL